ncbi:polysaccharide deacetylase family protein [Methanoculleus sp. 7T]|uniref:hypothetical protein n=1 Tax=Methanoculleus sp. 7T TaxID=2937282 RepID=UPI0020BD74A5|nr:hypothetical protein [Methanoculleus sp. 7T]
MRDFTLEKYGDLIRAILDAGYTTLTVRGCLTGNCRNMQRAVLRHDVDRRPVNALKMAELEASLGVAATYYFRYPATFVPEIIRQVHSLGHEVGYHYEVLAKAGGDYKKAIDLFARELAEFRTLCDVRTVCMHGSPLSRYDNRDLWKGYDFRDFGIEGEAYLSMAGKNLRYLTDTGRTWSGKHSLRDMMPDAEPVPVETTDDLVDWIESSGEEGLYLTVHPERWAVGEIEWVAGGVKDLLMNAGKMGVLAVMSISK